MKFIVERDEEDWNTEAPPCSIAVLEDVLRQDVRCVDDPKKVPAENGKSAWWYGKGLNHRIVDGQIVRDFLEKKWIVRLSSLEHLAVFI